MKEKRKFGLGKILAGVLVILFLVVVGVVLRYWLAYNGFLDKVTARRPEVKGYSVVVWGGEDSGTEEETAVEAGAEKIQKIGDLAGKSAGLLGTDPQAAKVRVKLEEAVSEEQDAEVTVDFYDDVSTMYEVLKNRLTTAMVLETDRVEMLKEEIEKFENETRVIYTFEVEISDEGIEIPDKEITKEPFVVYLSGSDSRTGIKTTARSDVNIVAVVNPEQGKILLVSIPRDTYVQLHGTTGLKDKLTHAGIYGINMSKTTIEDFLGISIDYTIKVSFETVVKVVDELDGIDIVSDTAMTLKSNGEVCEFIEGKQHVNGNCALRFARERKTYQTGDRHRGENQQQVITSIIGKLSESKNYLLRVPTILDIAADSFETTLTRENIASFIRMQLIEGIKWEVESVAVDGTATYAPTYSMGANRPLYVMNASEESVEKVRAKINEYLLAATSAEE